MPWTVADIPDLHGRTIVVTGANTGLGLETAAALAGAGATAVLACRNLAKAAAAQAELEARRPSGTIEVLQLDLADQAQIADAAAEALERFPRIDRLINNAGVLGLPHSLTADGFETVFGTNHLGHFAFTLRLLPALLEVPGSRVVTVSSMSHRVGRIPWDDLHGTKGYGTARVYARSKLANLLFAFELQRRLVRIGAPTISLAAHPGFASTDIITDMLAKVPEGAQRRMRAVADRSVSAAAAAGSSLRAATDPGAYGGQFYGPSGPGGIAGPPIVTPPARRSLDEAAQARLWDLSVAATGVDLPSPAAC